MTFEIAFHPLAADDLDRIYDFIAQNSPANAIAFVRRLRRQCFALSELPHRGRRLQDLPGETRSIVFERRAVIVYRIDPAVVIVLRIVYAGRNLIATPEEFDG